MKNNCKTRQATFAVKVVYDAIKPLDYGIFSDLYGTNWP